MSRKLKLVATGLLLVPQLGCVTTGFFPQQVDFIPKLQTSDAGLNGQLRKEPELSASDAAQACLKTAETMERSGHDGQAIQQYEMARQHDPKLTKVSRRLAVLYDRQGDVTRAMQEYRVALQQTPKDPDLFNDYGFFHYERGDWLEAEKWLRQALEQNPQHTRAAVNLGLTLGQQGRYPESLELFTKTIGEAEANVNLGFVYQTHGKRDEAKAAYRKAVQLRPDLRLAQAALAKLENAPAATDAVATNKPEAPSTPRDTAIAQQAAKEREKEAAIARLENFIQKAQAQGATVIRPTTESATTETTEPSLSLPPGTSLIGPVKPAGAMLGKPQAR